VAASQASQSQSQLEVEVDLTALREALRKLSLDLFGDSIWSECVGNMQYHLRHLDRQDAREYYESVCEDVDRIKAAVEYAEEVLAELQEEGVDTRALLTARNEIDLSAGRDQVEYMERWMRSIAPALSLAL
jgi:hypothetical protein